MLLQPLVSVLMTSYNREKYIAEAIQSVLDQTFTDFEFIIVDDASTDDTLYIARKYEAIDKRIKVYANDQNLGDYPNRKKAASYAVGKYIKYVDSDDILYPHGLDVMVRGMEKFPEAALGMVWGDPIFEPSPVSYSSHDAYYSYFFQNKWMQVGPSGSIYRRNAFEQVGGFDLLPYVGDFDLNLKLGALYPVVRLQTDLFFYRLHSGQQLNEGEHSTKGYEILNYKIQKRHLESVICPLSFAERKEAIIMTEKLQARRAFKKLLFQFSYQKFRNLIIDSGLGWCGFLRGIKTI
jgi:glycosyltransferase involved in cell wall biosynthesis